jgi:hypothetical protein
VLLLKIFLRIRCVLGSPPQNHLRLDITAVKSRPPDQRRTLLIRGTVVAASAIKVAAAVTDHVLAAEVAAVDRWWRGGTPWRELEDAVAPGQILTGVAGHPELAVPVGCA